MGNLTQSGRRGELKTPLGDNVLVLKSFSGTEELGELFGFYIEALSEDANLDFDKALGQACTIRLNTFQDKERFFCGILTQAQWVGADQYYNNYRLVLRPWPWLLGHNAGCRIYLDKNVKDIIQDVFTKAGFSNGTDFKFQTNGNYDTIDYCVQYRETDLAFVSRLMEQYGIYYFFEHRDGQHTMILADSYASHKAIPDLPQVNCHLTETTLTRTDQQLNTWTSDRRFRTGKVEYNDYDYTKPPKQLLASKEGSEKYARSDLEVYDYPGKYDDQDKGKQFAQFRLEAEQALDHRRMAGGDAPSLFPGGLVTVQKHPTSSENKDYLVVRAEHMFGTQYYSGSVSTDRGAAAYTGTYEFLQSDRPFRNLPLTPKPRIYGIQTAKVVGRKGEDGEEISTDEYGRIWVQFYWDKWEKSEPQKSCPIRVAQSWSGKQWGTQFIPRLGMEVVVEFLEGDPDRPLVTGCVYNGDNKVPYDLPGQKTQSGTKSDSSKGHGGYNEFMFEDMKGSELIRMHAEKDHLVLINANQTGYVGAVELNSPYQGGDQTWTVGHTRTWTIQKGDDKLIVQQGNLSIDVQMGDISVKADLGKIEVEAMQSITLKVGNNQVVIDMMGVHIQGMMVDTKANAMITESAPMIKIN